MHSVEDPWLVKDNSCPRRGSDCNSFCDNLEFEDNFDVNNYRLPDSEEYLAALEKKLDKLKKSKVNASEKSTRKELVSSLQEFRESCMVRLISGSSSDLKSEVDFDLDSTVPKLPAQWLLNQINPEKPITVGEVLELLKADYLQLQNPEVETDVESVEKEN